MPEFTKPTAMTLVAEEDWITAVTTLPSSTALSRLEVSRARMVSSRLPATFFSASLISDMPKRKNARPPSSVITEAALIVWYQTFP